MLIFLWIIFALSGLGIIAVFVSKVPEAEERQITVRVKLQQTSESLMHYFWQKAKLGFNKVWHFILEAKDLKPQVNLNQGMEKMKQVFKVRIRHSEQEPLWMPEVVQLTPSVKQAEGTTAEELYLQAIKKNPEDAGAYEALGRLYLQERNFADALETFQFLTKFKPDKDVYWSNLGLCYFSVKNYPLAVSAYEKALSLNSKVPVRWMNLALCFEKQDELAKAIKAIAAALQLDGRNISYLQLQADFYVKAQNKVRAEQVLQQILELEPTNRLAREKLMKLKI